MTFSFFPYSHDEVVHGKKTMVDKVFGSQQEQFATIRALYTFQFTHPGKKLNFMGNELGEYLEWRDEKRAWLEFAHISYTRFITRVCESTPQALS